jgi:alpha-acetolactate decarboxylase
VIYKSILLIKIAQLPFHAKIREQRASSVTKMLEQTQPEVRASAKQPLAPKNPHAAVETLPDHFMLNTVTNDIYQYSNLSVPHGLAIPGLTVQQIGKCGDHGIGVFEGREGELVYINSKPIQVVADEGGYVNVTVPLKICATPITFFTGVDFVPQITAMKEGMNVAKLEQLFRGSDEGALKEAFTTFKIHGVFENVSLRITGAATQPEPFSYTLLDMAKRISADGSKGHIDTGAITGTIFGFYAPEWAKDLCWSGIKCWFDAPPKNIGQKSRGEGYVRARSTGHVADFKTKNAVKVEWAVARKWHWQTNDGKCFGAVRPGTENEKKAIILLSSDEEEDSDSDEEEDCDSDEEEDSDSDDEEDSDSDEEMGSGDSEGDGRSGSEHEGGGEYEGDGQEMAFL